MGSRPENLDRRRARQEKLSPPHPTTPVSERPTQPLCSKEVASLGQEIRIFPIMFIEICSNHTNVCYCLCNLT